MAESPELKRGRMALELADFEAIFPELVTELTSVGCLETAPARNYFKKVCEYNVPYGKKNRGITVVESYRHLVPKPSEADLHIARVVGWCIEWLQAFFLVADDIMDQSETRRGKLCWYKQEGVGLEAINDSYFLENAVYTLLKKYCREKPYYVHLLELFHETTQQTVTGQCLDMLTAHKANEDIQAHFTLQAYKAIVKYKTAFYSFYLPVACAMYMAGISDDVLHGTASTILLKMGEYFQIQDDYLDCYGDPTVTGKVGTDIQDNKCSWIVVQALQKADNQQLNNLRKYYGKTDETSIGKVKDVFKELDIEDIYRVYEENSFVDIMNLVDQLPEALPKAMFTAFVNKIYKRQK